MTSRKIAPNDANRRIDRDVGARAREQLARLPAVVEADLEPLQVLVEVVADARLDVGRDVGEVEAPAVREPEIEDREHDGEREEWPEPGRVPVLDRPVDRGRDDERDRELATRSTRSRRP